MIALFSWSFVYDEVTYGLVYTGPKTLKVVSQNILLSSHKFSAINVLFQYKNKIYLVKPISDGQESR